MKLKFTFCTLSEEKKTISHLNRQVRISYPIQVRTFKLSTEEFHIVMLFSKDVAYYGYKEVRVREWECVRKSDKITLDPIKHL